MLAAFLAQALCAQNSGQILTNCAQVLGLSPEAANQEHVGRIRGVVTCYIPASQLCFIQDETSGLYVYPSPWPKDLSLGSIVEVEGVTGAGRFSPILQRARIAPVGGTKVVTPRKVSIEELTSGQFDCHLVEIEGIVQGVEAGSDVRVLKVVSGGSSVNALFYNWDSSVTNLVDARVRLRGVAGTYYNGEKLIGFGMFVQGKEGVDVIAPANDPFEAPLRTTKKLAWFSPDGAMHHRVRLRGLVTVAWPPRTFFLEDQFGPIQVLTQTGHPLPDAGDEVEVSGFIRDATGATPSIANAIWKKTGSGQPTEPKIVGAEDLLKRPATGPLVATEATVTNHRKVGELTLLLLQDRGVTVPAFVQNLFEETLVDARIRATGAWGPCPVELGLQGGPGIWLNSTNDLVILSPAPAKNATGVDRGLPALLIAGVAFIGLGGMLAWRGYSSVRRAADEKESTREQLTKLERELKQLKDSRERLGRDLHDHIIQSIYATGLNLEECRQLLNEPNKAEPRLRTALTEVNSVIRELRNVIHGLETNAIQPGEFRTALKSLALMLGDTGSSRVRLELDQEAVDALTPQQATELVHIGREAVSNSVRHGKAFTTTFDLREVSGKLRFTIEDDGCGFVADAAEARGYGLRNMAKRAEGLGAEFQIRSQEGTGTRIVLDIPKQKQHF